jgi:N-acetylmuramate 1-kinase
MSEHPTTTSGLQADIQPLWPHAPRQTVFDAWLAPLQDKYQLQAATLRFAAADADFRRYLRIDGAMGTFIIMDAPPEKMVCDAYVRCAGLVQAAGLKGPQVLEWSAASGFMLLTDLGDLTLMQTIQPDAPPPAKAYQDAVDVLLQWQLSSKPDTLPAYDRALLLREMELYPQWYVAEHRHFTLDATQRKVLDTAFATIVDHNLAWPSVFVHRDFMPRNLMTPRSSDPDQRLGVLDFQDAVYGPITYDIASLVRDAFVTWEEDFCLDIVIRYWEKARKAGLPVGDDFGAFYQAVEWMGLQRHIKIAGIFARLTLRDCKPKYLADTPRFIEYIRSTCSRYMALKPLLRLVEKIDGIEVPNAFAFGRT